MGKQINRRGLGTSGRPLLFLARKANLNAFSTLETSTVQMGLSFMAVTQILTLEPV